MTKIGLKMFFYNQDDHAKNFSFIYDLTHSSTYYDEQTISINNKGINITDEDLLIVGMKVGLDEDKCV